MAIKAWFFVFALCCSGISWSAESTVSWASELPQGGAPWKGDQASSKCPPSHSLDVASEVLRLSYASDPRLYERASAVVGVTSLGRVVVVLDTNADGNADQYIQLTDANRHGAPWSKLVERATILLTKGTLRLEAPDQSIGIVAGVDGSELPRLSRDPAVYRTYISLPAVVELLELSAIEKIPLGEVDLVNLYALPERLRQDSDAFTPQTGPTNCNCDEDACDQGGCGASQCMLSGCSVTCAQPQNYFACCNYVTLLPNTCKCIRYDPSCWQ